MTSLADSLPERAVPPELSEDLAGLAPTVLTHTDLGHVSDCVALLDRARDRANRWEEAARTKFRKARDEGHRKGHAEATETLFRDRIDLAARIEILRAEQADQLEHLVAEALRRFYGAAPFDALVAAAVSEALAQSSGAPATVLAATPSDLAALEAHGTEWPLDRLADASLQDGEVELRGEGSVVCISLDRHRDALLRALAHPGGSSDG